MPASRVLVTGSRGFLGTHVVRALLATGREVAILMRGTAAREPVAKAPERLTILPANLQDPAALRRQLEEWRPDACIHLAWYAEPGRYLEAPENVAALNGTLALLQELMRVDCASVAMTGTCAEYDTDQGWLHEDTPLRPRTLYAASKASASLLAQQLAKGSRTNVAWARVFYPYGPFEDHRRAVPALITHLLEGRRFAASSGEQVRDYIYATDVADAFVTLIDRNATGSFNVSSGTPITVRGLMETIGDRLGRRELIDFGAATARGWEPRFICGDNSRLRALDWVPKYTLGQGVDETIAWWRARQ